MNRIFQKKIIALFTLVTVIVSQKSWYSENLNSLKFQLFANVAKEKYKKISSNPLFNQTNLRVHTDMVNAVGLIANWELNLNEKISQ